MKKLLFIAFIMAATKAMAQAGQPFKGYFYNEQYNVYLNIDLYGDGINVPDHELFGPLPGYLGKRLNSFFWLITSSKVINSSKAQIELINDYGSEDLKATLRIPNDSTLILHQDEGSTIKVPNNRKWQKLPTTLEFRRQ